MIVPVLIITIVTFVNGEVKYNGLRLEVDSWLFSTKQDGLNLLLVKQVVK